MGSFKSVERLVALVKSPLGRPLCILKSLLLTTGWVSAWYERPAGERCVLERVRGVASEASDVRRKIERPGPNLFYCFA